jgi:hypothetical protein
MHAEYEHLNLVSELFPAKNRAKKGIKNQFATKPEMLDRLRKSPATRPAKAMRSDQNGKPREI